MRIKGTMLSDYIRIIRANKDKDWGPYLTPGDWELINGQVLLSSWYPLEIYRRVAFAVFKVVAKGNLDTARTFGRFNIKSMMQTYGNFIEPGNPMAGAEKLNRIRRTLIEGADEARLTRIGEREFVYAMPVQKAEKDKEVMDAFAYSVAGHLEEIVNLSGGKNVKVAVQPDAEYYNLRVSWE